MACAAGISVTQMQHAHDLTLQTLGYTIIPKITPHTIGAPVTTGNRKLSPWVLESPDNTVAFTDLVHSPIKQMGNLSGTPTPPDPPSHTLPFLAAHDTASNLYTSPPINSFGPHVELGPNRWVNERDTFFVLQRYHDFQKATPVPNLVLNCKINKLEHIFSLAAEITGTSLTAQQVANVCAQPAESDANPATRFNNATIPTIEAVDTGYYLTGQIELYSILLGRSGPLYNNEHKCPPKGAVILMKLICTVPNTRDPVYEHAIFIPDLQLLITINTHVDTKTKGKQV
jgi:hypothetical protein